MTSKTTCWGVAGLVLAAAWVAREAKAQDPTEFLRRLDTNNDGMIDASELEGRFGGFILRMAENNPRIDFSRPVPISRLSEEFTRMREERMQAGGGGPPFGGPGGGPPGGGPGGGGQGRGGPPGSGPPGRGGEDQRRGGGEDQRRGGGEDQRRGDEQNNPYRRTEATEIRPLIPGFGEEEVLAPPLGFGAEGELFSVQITEQDRQEAARAFRYYDRNNDGQIDQEEMRRSRQGMDLLQYDRNRDGVITLDEMEYRYARRRIENTRRSAAGGDPQAAEGGERRRRGGREGGREGGEGPSEENSNPSPYAALSSYRVVAPVERLPKELPDWFYRNDADGDGQISMAEFSATWTEAVLEDFYRFDLNRDGLITADEALRAQAAGAVRGTAVSAAASGGAEEGTREAAASSGEESAEAAEGDSAAAASRESGPPIDPRYMDYFKKLIAKYDTNGDGVLTEDEWVNMSRNPAAADVNGDGKITVEEYARWSLKR